VKTSWMRAAAILAWVIMWGITPSWCDSTVYNAIGLGGGFSSSMQDNTGYASVYGLAGNTWVGLDGPAALYGNNTCTQMVCLPGQVFDGVVSADGEYGSVGNTMLIGSVGWDISFADFVIPASGIYTEGGAISANGSLCVTLDDYYCEYPAINYLINIYGPGEVSFSFQPVDGGFMFPGISFTAYDPAPEPSAYISFLGGLGLVAGLGGLRLSRKQVALPA
jgi:hypothetical protein